MQYERVNSHLSFTFRSSLALMIYRDIIGAGLIPSAEMLSQILGCLQLPQDISLKKRLTESLKISAETSRKANLLSLVDGFAEYDIRAFSLFEVSPHWVTLSVAWLVYRFLK